MVYEFIRFHFSKKFLFSIIKFIKTVNNTDKNKKN
jgi:hypothetical protein